MARYNSMAADRAARACSRGRSGSTAAQTAVAVGRERAHAQFSLRGRGPAGSRFRPARTLRRLAMRGDLAEEAQGIGLVAMFLVRRASVSACSARVLRLLQTASQHLRLPQGATTERLNLYYSRCHGMLHRLREQRHRVGDTPGQGVRCSQRCRHGRRNGPNARPDRCAQPARAGEVSWPSRLGGAPADRVPMRPS